MAMRLGLNSSSLRARCTGRPRIDWATRFSLRALVRRERTFDIASLGPRRRSLACLLMLLPLGLLVGGVAGKVAGGRELAELHADHVLAYQHGHVLLAVVHAEGQAHELGHDRRAARPDLDHLLAARILDGFRLLEQIAVDERAFPNRAGHGLARFLHVASADDESIRGLVGAGLAALGGLAPRGNQVAAAGGLALAAAVRVVDRVHGHAAHVRAAALVAHAPGL